MNVQTAKQLRRRCTCNTATRQWTVTPAGGEPSTERLCGLCADQLVEAGYTVVEIPRPRYDWTPTTGLRFLSAEAARHEIDVLRITYPGATFRVRSSALLGYSVAR